jgi:rod shape determining protein RodA
MWTTKYFSRIDIRACLIIAALNVVSLLIIASYSAADMQEAFFTPLVKAQAQWFLMGWVLFFLFAGFDYSKLREWAWVLYLLSILALIGLFFTEPIQRVHRWYRLPVISHHFQPSEYAKITLVIALSWFLERRASVSRKISTSIGGLLIALIPFLLIYKEPDLGTALVLMPITLVMFYFGDLSPFIVRSMLVAGVVLLVLTGAFFTGVISHEKARPFFLKVIKEYQYERLNPNTHHKNAACLAIAVGGVSGVGFKESEYARQGSLPFPYTDSAFAAFGEEFGIFGLAFLLVLFYGLVYCSFQVTAVAKDAFGRLLAAGIAVLLAVQTCVNIGMMCGLLPITGVPLLLVSYGGSSVLSTMMALGVLQSVYSRRFMF